MSDEVVLRSSIIQIIVFIVCAAIVSVGSSYISVGIAMAKQNETLSSNRERIVALEAQSAYLRSIDQRLSRIEGKLDVHSSR